MSKQDIKNLPASIQDRLLNQARASGRPFNELLQYYAIERFLYRLAQSSYAGQFILKGALLFRVWGLRAFRPTRDIDLLGQTNNELDDLVGIIRVICMQKVQDDGMFFDPEQLAENGSKKMQTMKAFGYGLLACSEKPVFIYRSMSVLQMLFRLLP